MSQQGRRILLTGATGYVGGRLLPHLRARGHTVRCLTRRPEDLRGLAEEVVKADLLSPPTLSEALAGVHTAYYLVHSMGAEGDFAQKDRQGAMNFAAASREAHIQRIIYLGGLGRSQEDLSPHLQSRHEVGALLAASGVPTLEFRAAIVIGPGSFSFEMVRALVERLPIMVTPRWVNQRTQPIAVDDLTNYLLEALDVPLKGHLIVEVGGADQVTYADLMAEYARQRGLRRVMVPVPFLSPRLSRLWLGLVTPYFARVGKTLIESIKNATVVEDPRARELFSVVPMGMVEAVRRALEGER